MVDIFAGSEIVELGIQIEKNGRDFYNVLFKQSKDKKVKDIFKYLADEEERHIAVFQKILAKKEKYQPPEAYPDEYFAYMNALASQYVFTKKDEGEKIAKSVKLEKDAIDLGIGFEKDSILFYEGMKKVILEVDYDTIYELIIAEQRHLRQLLDLKNNYFKIKEV